MRRFLDKFTTDIAELCEQYGVLKLDAIGSVLTEDFTENSDVDFVVRFHRNEDTNAFEQFFGLKEALCELLERDVDLICEPAISNRYFKEEVEATRVPFYAA